MLLVERTNSPCFVFVQLLSMQWDLKAKLHCTWQSMEFVYRSVKLLFFVGAADLWLTV